MSRRGLVRQTWLCAVIVIAAALYLHHEVLWGGMVYHMDDAADGYYPSHVAALRALRSGELPTWERGAWSGWPLLANPYYAFYYPLTALFYIVGPVKGLGVDIAVHALIASLGMFWLARRRGLAQGPALLAAVAFGFSSFMVVRIRHIIFPQSLAWVPILLAAIDGWLASARRRDLGIAAFASGMILVSGAIPLLPYVVILVAAYVLPRLLDPATPERLRKSGGLALAATVGALIGMAQVVPTLAHLSESPRSLGADYAFASSYAWPDVGYMATLVAPDLFGTEQHWFGVYNHWEMAGYYVGALTLALAPVGLLRRGRPERWTLFGAALLGVGLAFGDAGPFHPWFFRHVPLYATIRCPTRALVMALVAMPILAADGLAWLSSRAGRSRPAATFCTAATFVVAGAIVWRAAAPVAHLAIVAGAGGGILALLVGGWMPVPAVEYAIALVTLADLLVVGRAAIQPKPADFAAGTERYAAVDWLLDRRPSERFVADPRGPFRLHNIGMTYGPPLEGASGYDSFAIWRYVNFLWTVNAGTPYPSRALADDLAAGTIARFDSPWVDFLNVRWAIAPWPPASGWIERFRLPPGAPVHARYEEAWDRSLKVYENPHVLPRAFVVHRAEVVADDNAAAAALNRIDPATTVVLDRQPAIQPVAGDRPLTSARRVDVERHRLAIDIDNPEPGILVMSEPAYPGWTATVDGTPAPLLRANYAFRGVALDGGSHHVELRFTSRPAEAGIALSVVGLLSLIALATYERRPGAIRP